MGPKNLWYDGTFSPQYFCVKIILCPSNLGLQKFKGQKTISVSKSVDVQKFDVAKIFGKKNVGLKHLGTNNFLGYDNV